MARRLINGRLRHVEQPQGFEASRLVVLAYLIAILLALGAGVLWMSWHLLGRLFW